MIMVRLTVNLFDFLILICYTRIVIIRILRGCCWRIQQPPRRFKTMSWLVGCCHRNENGEETYYSNGCYYCAFCGSSVEDDGEDPEEYYN